MECTVCNERSQVDSCVQCHALLCEVCGETCEKCGEMACPDHTKRTSSGHILCYKCYERRRAKKEARRQAEGAGAGAGGTGFQDLSGTKRPEGEEEEREEHAALTKSAQTNWPPWKLSLFAAIAGVVIVVVLLIVPEFRRIPLAGDSYLHTSLFVIILAAIAGVWAAIGLVSKDPESIENRGRCFAGLALGVLSAILAVVAIVTDPAKELEEENLRRQQEQQQLTPEERRQQRREILNQFR